MSEVIDYRFRMRRAYKATWTALNDILLDGEWGWERDTGLLKIGDGVTRWNSLPYHRYGVRVLTDAPSIALDASLGDNWRVTLGGDRTLANPTNLVDGQVFNIRIKQDGTGGRTLAYGNKFKFPGGVAPVLSTAIDATDFMSCQYDATDDTIFGVLNKAFG